MRSTVGAEEAFLFPLELDVVFQGASSRARWYLLTESVLSIDHFSASSSNACSPMMNARSSASCEVFFWSSAPESFLRVVQLAIFWSMRHACLKGMKSLRSINAYLSCLLAPYFHTRTFNLLERSPSAFCICRQTRAN